MISVCILVKGLTLAKCYISRNKLVVCLFIRYPRIHSHTQNSLCCSEVCRLYKRRAKQRRDRLNSDEISLLPAQVNGQQEVEGTDGQGYGNMSHTDVLTTGPSRVNMGFKVSVTSDLKYGPRVVASLNHPSTLKIILVATSN